LQLLRYGNSLFAPIGASVLAFAYLVVPYEPFFCQNIYIKMAFSALFYWKNTIKGMIKIARFCKIFQKALQSMRKIRTIQSQYSK
jgi:hypothetical protein